MNPRAAYDRRVTLDAYFNRLNIERTAQPTLETLRRVHIAHHAAFPFHNLTIQRRGAVTVDVESIAKRFLEPGGGGYCFEQNTLLGAALRELGFEVTTLLGRVGPSERRMLSHMLLRIDIDGRPWIADVGFGGQSPLEPMPLEEGRVTQQGFDYSLRRDADHWKLTMHCGDSSEDMYEFSGAAHTIGDVEMANYYTSTNPASIFRNTLTIQRVTPEERVILRPKVVTRYRDGARTDTEIEPAQVRALARELFGIELGDAPLLFEQV